jgi:hypothetical protein
METNKNFLGKINTQRCSVTLKSFETVVTRSFYILHNVSEECGLALNVITNLLQMI